MNDHQSEGSSSVPQQLAFIRDETRFEIGLLHERVNTLVAAEAFLTIAYTTAMGNTASWGVTFSAVVAPTLSVLGLLLALLAWPGIYATVRIVLTWTARAPNSSSVTSSSQPQRNVPTRPGAPPRTLRSVAQHALLQSSARTVHDRLGGPDNRGAHPSPIRPDPLAHGKYAGTTPSLRSEGTGPFSRSRRTTPNRSKRTCPTWCRWWT